MLILQIGQRAWRGEKEEISAARARRLNAQGWGPKCAIQHRREVFSRTKWRALEGRLAARWRGYLGRLSIRLASGALVCVLCSRPAPLGAQSNSHADQRNRARSIRLAADQIRARA